MDTKISRPKPGTKVLKIVSILAQNFSKKMNLAE